MQREIYEVDAKIVDSNRTFNTLTGYPKIFDSRSYDNDIDRTKQRAMGCFYDALSSMSKVDSRFLQVAMVTRMSDGVQIAIDRFGDMPEEPES